MIEIRNYPGIRHLRSDASSYVMKYARGQCIASGRGLSFWFRPDQVSLQELPMDDRQTPFVINARSSDFQDVMVQGTLLWRIRDAERISERVDFSIDLRRGTHIATPMDYIRNLLASHVQQAATDYLGALAVRDALDTGVRAIQTYLSEQLTEAVALSELGLEVITLHVADVKPSADLARALQTPTFEKIQQQADEATFARRAMAVEKEQAIAENELKTRIELARRERELIDRDTENARQRAEGDAAAALVKATADAEEIRLIEGARNQAEEGRINLYRDLPTSTHIGLAATEFAGSIGTIEHLNITPELLAALGTEFKRIARKDD
ncbi:SPFH domain-containing protein [Maricaulis sp.]|jgi:regulator of protease activity HflC (stomatin/prohibitin superfamily)|uniref:SPFH domain-containing protein n=1 Tax=Maricaulis sp. TaxID=1486257 RepID=UPI0025EE5CB7|nr:SPFH domain-containing protein [Maricaulis sp.]MDF1767866.1 SPFH domain-containing protein [Maricaulis sp.]